MHALDVVLGFIDRGEAAKEMFRCHEAMLSFCSMLLIFIGARDIVYDNVSIIASPKMTCDLKLGQKANVVFEFSTQQKANSFTFTFRAVTKNKLIVYEIFKRG